MKLRFYIAVVLVVVCLSGCNSEEWDSMPQEIQKFVAKYYPGSIIESYSDDSSGYRVVIKDGATMVFSTPSSWQSVNGNGVVLPVLFVENEMPTALYRYLSETEAVGGVYVATRDARVYRLQMFDAELVYNISTEQVSYTTKLASSASANISLSPRLSP